jgi:hypothetical protein
MVEQVVVVDENVGHVDLLQAALVKQGELGRRIVDAKTRTTAGEIEKALDDVCRDVLSYISEWVAVGKRAVFGEGCVLSWAEEYWNELTPLHAQYASFDELAKAETGEEYSTYRAKIAVYRTFIENRYNVPKIAEIGSVRFLDVPMGKLQKAVAKAKKNELDDDQWDALLDPNVNDAQFRAIIGQDAAGRNASNKKFLEGGNTNVTVDGVGKLRYWPNHEEILASEGKAEIGIEIGYLNVGSQDETIREIVGHIVEKAGIRRI